MTYKTHYNISAFLFILLVIILAGTIPGAIILKKQTLYYSIILVPFYLFFKYGVKATCKKRKCNGAKLYRSSDWKPSTFFSDGPYNVIYTCKNYGDVNKITEGYSWYN